MLSPVLVMRLRLYLNYKCQRKNCQDKKGGCLSAAAFFIKLSACPKHALSVLEVQLYAMPEAPGIGNLAA
jgi:hypothetical protein